MMHKHTLELLSTLFVLIYWASCVVVFCFKINVNPWPTGMAPVIKPIGCEKYVVSDLI